VLTLLVFYKVVKSIYHLKFMKGHDLAERYGPGTWAVITGSTGGIGSEFAN